mmetsp:Transcript_25268/g.71992  ORF Transcript_25268/g.71992 Transcript_25268/m.71992 type:complete len:272 (-) Transcript_25268:84-899(-)
MRFRVCLVAAVVAFPVGTARLVARRLSFSPVFFSDSLSGEASAGDTRNEAAGIDFISQGKADRSLYAAGPSAASEIRRLAYDGQSQRQFCDPHCGWTCGPSPKCNQVCEPVCAPPVCRTLCGRNPDTCETRCGGPQCAVICPQEEEGCPAAGPACGKCRTVCSPPVCTTDCGDDCRNVCEKPLCSWKCRLPSCPKPRCQLTCNGFAHCAATFQPSNATMPPPYPEEAVVGVTMGIASLDPSSLMKRVTPPPPFHRLDGTRVTPFLLPVEGK